LPTFKIIKKHIMIKKFIFCFLLLFTLAVYHLRSQVTVGDIKEPETFSALELISQTGGLRHPHMTTVQRNALTTSLSQADAIKAQGLMIYNTDTECLEFFRNETEGWVSLCNTAILPALSADLAVTIRPYDNVTDAALTLTSPIGTPGKAKYDIAQTNSSLNGSCGKLGAPFGRPGDFGTFNAVGLLRKYYVIEFPMNPIAYSGLVVGEGQYAVKLLAGINASPTGSVLQKHLITVDFSATVRDKALATDESTALHTTLYAVFKKGDQLYKVEYPIIVMDCLGCGVRVPAGDKEWIKVACYNMGVRPDVTSANPLVYNDNIIGDRYQWGRQTDGHEKYIDNIGQYVYQPTVALGEITYSTAPLDSLDANGQPTGGRRGIFIPVGSYERFGYDWSVQHNPKLWGDGSQNAHAPKTVNDPCPAGFRVPTKAEMTKILSGLSLSVHDKGFKATGDGVLFLPFIKPVRPDGTLYDIDNLAYYWTSTVAGEAVPDYSSSANAFVYDNPKNGVEPVGKTYGVALRCIGE
jgi:hypothetical protein